MKMLEVLDAYGLRKIPFPSVYMQTADSLKIGRLLGMAMSAKRTIAVVGDRGIGKTWAIEAALKGKDCHIVHCERNNKERMLIDDIERDLISALGNGENPRRMGQARGSQIRRVVGEAARQKPVVLLIEEAHRLHPSTLRSLKSLLEKDWMGVRPLLTPVLIGQYDPLSKEGVSEVRLRSDTVQMHGLSAAEAKEYITQTVGRHFDPEAAEATSRLEQARNYLELQEAIIKLMERALMSGRRIVTAIDVLDIYGGGIKEIMSRTGVEASEMARDLGMSKAQVSLIANDRQDKLSSETYQTGKGLIGDYLKRKLEEQQPHGKADLKAVGK